jgi:hypothetical protein
MTYRFKDSKVPISFTTNYVASNRVESTNVKLSDFTAVNYSGGVFPGIGIVDLSAQTSMFRSFQMSGAGDYEPVTPFKIIYGFHGSSDFPWTGVWMKFFDSATTNFSIMKTLSKDGLDPDCSGVNMNSTLSVMDVASTATTTTGCVCVGIHKRTNIDIQVCANRHTILTAYSAQIGILHGGQGESGNCERRKSGDNGQFDGFHDGSHFKKLNKTKIKLFLTEPGSWLPKSPGGVFSFPNCNSVKTIR